MKIPGKRPIDGNELVEAEKFKNPRAKSAGDKSQGVGQLINSLKEDSVKVSDIAKFLNGELNPTTLAEDRKAKIAALKEQIANGTYNPSSIEVAKALVGEIAEVISDGSAWYNDDETTV